ncbi:MAG: retropepsin-like aspartic protease [Thermodesulfobacteriota bacterium]
MAVLVLASWQPGSGGQLHHWVDDKGVPHLTSTPPPKGRPEISTYSFPERPPAAPEPALQETPVTIADNLVLVPVRITVGRQIVEATLLLDTGAAVTALHRQAAGRLRLAARSQAELVVAGGRTVTAEVVEADSVQVGPILRRQVAVSIIDHQGPPVPFDGLLGMSFLKGLEYRIDFDRQRLLWSRPEP